MKTPPKQPQIRIFSQFLLGTWSDLSMPHNTPSFMEQVCFTRGAMLFTLNTQALQTG
jgi:hypothetical protein